jgi:D-glycero-alpha-D-manno-heptose-7-phosphate kinase
VEHPVIARRAHAEAPVRLDLAGAWTDVPPFSVREGGAVVAATIDLKVHVNVLPGGESVELVSDDLGVHETLGEGASRVPLLAHAVRRLPVGPATIVSRSDAPPGSGLGTSGAMGVATIAALHHARGDRVDAERVAREAWEVETQDAGIAGGRQDQWMAALGGFRLLAFRDPDVASEPIAVDAGFAAELAEAMVLCYTGVSRVSGGTITRVMAAYERGDPGVTAALRGLRDLASAMRDALRQSRLDDVARILDANWEYQRQLDPAMCTPEMAAVEAAARRQGARGGKAAGSGAGGCMFFVAPGCRGAVEAATRRAGATILPVRWSREGVTSW